MIVLDLSCANEHRFEGWFASSAAFEAQRARGLVNCPVCNTAEVRRLPSAPYVQTRSAQTPASSGAQASSAPALPTRAPATPVSGLPSPAAVAELLGTLRRMAKSAEDVGERLPEEARRIHYDEAPQRGIRGVATAEQQAELHDEGIEVFSFPLPGPAKEPLQ